MLSTLLDFVFPRQSLAGAEGEWVTTAELSELKQCMPVVETKAELEARGLEHLDSICAAAAYDASPLLKRAIHTFKFRRVPGLAAELGSLVARAPFAEHYTVDTVLCPVPLHWKRQFSRGFNQANKLAQAIGRQCNLLVTPFLKRTRHTGFQSHRNRAERLCALRGAFAFVERFDVPRVVVLVDDVATTGATLDACAHELKKRGVEEVHAWVVAHG